MPTFNYPADTADTSNPVVGVPRQTDAVAPGTYEAEIRWVEEKTTKNGDPALSIRLVEVGTGAHLCWDYLNFAGKGAGITQKKFAALGVELVSGQHFDGRDLVGKKAFVSLKHEPSWSNPKEMEAKVNINNFRDYCGFWPHSQPPTEITRTGETLAVEQPTSGPVEATEDDTPF